MNTFHTRQIAFFRFILTKNSILLSSFLLSIDFDHKILLKIH